MCSGVFRLTGDGSVYRHGGKSKGSQCPGSRQAPSTVLFLTTDSGADPEAHQQGSHAQFPLGPADTNAFPSDDVLAFTLSGVRYRLVDHIPKSARANCGTLLASLLDRILADPQNVESWAVLLSFGPAILGKPPRGGVVGAM